MAAAASTTMSSAQHALHMHEGLESQQAQHYEDLDGAFAAEVAARATAQAHGISASHDEHDPSESLDGAPSLVTRHVQEKNTSSGGANSSKQSDVPRNSHGRIVCPHPSCAAPEVTFDRKCEWTKHMDKHERPYVCDEPGCEKLRGFTYSGGLLRHQREVHKQHGGPKEMLMCPFPYCKRNVGTGFTRKENLHEHIRRVHRGAPEPPGVPTQQQAVNNGTGAEDLGNGSVNGGSSEDLQRAAPSLLPQAQREDHMENEQLQEGNGIAASPDHSASDYLPHGQQSQQQQSPDDRLVALQRSVQSYVPHSNKSRKRKSSSQVHDDPVHFLLGREQQQQQQPQSGEQQHAENDSGTDLEHKLDLLRNMDPSRLGLGQEARDELDHLRAENQRLRLEAEEKDLRLRELESVVQFMTQQQEMRP